MVASALGGIPTQVVHKMTGMLVHFIEGTACHIRYLFSNPAGLAVLVVFSEEAAAIRSIPVQIGAHFPGRFVASIQPARRLETEKPFGWNIL